MDAGSRGQDEIMSENAMSRVAPSQPDAERIVGGLDLGVRHPPPGVHDVGDL